MKRTDWTDGRLDEKIGAIDSTFDMLRDELQGLRADNREQFGLLRVDIRDMRQDMREMRTDFASLQGRLLQIGFGLVGVLLATLVTLVVTLG